MIFKPDPDPSQAPWSGRIRYDAWLGTQHHKSPIVLLLYPSGVMFNIAVRISKFQMSEKCCPFLYSDSLYKYGQDFLAIQYTLLLALKGMNNTNKIIWVRNTFFVKRTCKQLAKLILNQPSQNENYVQFKNHGLFSSLP